VRVLFIGTSLKIQAFLFTSKNLNGASAYIQFKESWLFNAFSFQKSENAKWNNDYIKETSLFSGSLRTCQILFILAAALFLAFEGAILFNWQIKHGEEFLVMKLLGVHLDWPIRYLFGRQLILFGLTFLYGCMHFSLFVNIVAAAFITGWMIEAYFVLKSQSRPAKISEKRRARRKQGKVTPFKIALYAFMDRLFAQLGFSLLFSMLLSYLAVQSQNTLLYSQNRMEAKADMLFISSLFIWCLVFGLLCFCLKFYCAFWQKNFYPLAPLFYELAIPFKARQKVVLSSILMHAAITALLSFLLGWSTSYSILGVVLLGYFCLLSICIFFQTNKSEKPVS
jgi:hypothetical protein